MSFEQPWLLTPVQFSEIALFHGSCEPWRTPEPQGGGYDEVFWTAEDPLTAQIYIPTWHGEMLFSIDEYRLAESIIPDTSSFLWGIAEHLGARAVIHRSDALGRAESWSSTGKDITYGDIKAHLQSLGYTGSGYCNENFRVKDAYKAQLDGSKIKVPIPAATFPLGRLVMIPRPPQQDDIDFREGRDPDLTEKQYHMIDRFRTAFAQGAQSIRINDFCQSPYMGNVGHTSIGFHSDTMKSLSDAGLVRIIPATHRDFAGSWSKYPDDFLTEDFLQWHFGETVRAIALGQEVPAEVIDAHQVRLDQVLATAQGEDPFLITVGLDSLRLPQPAAGLNEARMAELTWEIEINSWRQAGSFSVNSLGGLHYCGEPEFIEAVRQKGYCVPVTATMLNSDGHTVTCAMITDAIALAREPAVVDLSYP
ncbi:hypothetical protein PkP19E3_33465 (plasmid) [Pseudomonas koreensis]|nr:hypothetical protein PkP19E3_33465 [Pseudomonas koreensis]